jgi:hypothetical protein
MFYAIGDGVTAGRIKTSGGRYIIRTVKKFKFRLTLVYSGHYFFELAVVGYNI